MIVYHGTVDAYLPSIEKSGLKVVPKNRFKAERSLFFATLPMPLEPGIYVTTNKLAAENFALMRALWLSVPLNETVDVTIAPLPLFKREGEVIEHAKPIVLKLQLGKTLTASLKIDDKSGSSDAKPYAFWTPKTIPPSCIKKVLTPPQQPHYWGDSNDASH